MAGMDLYVIHFSHFYGGFYVESICVRCSRVVPGDRRERHWTSMSSCTDALNTWT